ncbi:hypothetical protein TNCV_3932031, partial [Trichonephila clavipes]
HVTEGVSWFLIETGIHYRGNPTSMPYSGPERGHGPMSGDPKHIHALFGIRTRAHSVASRESYPPHWLGRSYEG